ncbi:hypothetical protein FOL47_005433 [Perkinsus chesapeaki]|uniref:UvrD-like helicase ATP-binding domain-containing protein n=1 Tax=Perkinsus chesapeaki TaxID=330153 RepID=A0A7J6MZ24_PERCH|nr:hypothetical protein FOL47_005433 [Perkinsus chesapeaki]
MIRLRPSALRRAPSCIGQLYRASRRSFTAVASPVDEASLEKDENPEEVANEAVTEALTPPHYIFPPSQTDMSALESDLWTFLGPEGFPEEFLVAQFLKEKLETVEAVNALEAHDCIVVFRMVERFIHNCGNKKELAPILGLVLQRLEEIAPQASKRLISVLLSTLNTVGQWAPEYSDLRQGAEGLGKRLLATFVDDRKEFATPPRYLGRVCRFLVEYPGCSTARVVDYIDTVSTELLRAGGVGSLEEDMSNRGEGWWSTQTLSDKMHQKEVRERIKEALHLARNNAAGLSHENAVTVLEACGRLPPMKGMSKLVYQAKLRLLREPWLCPIGPSIAALGKLGAWNKSCRSMYLMLAHKASLPGMSPESLSAMVGGGLATTTQNLGRKEEPDIVGEPQPRNAAFPRKEFIVAAIQRSVLDDLKGGGMKLTAAGTALWTVCVGGLHLEMPQGVKQTPTERPWKLTGFEDGKELLLRSLGDVSLVCGRCRGGSPASLAGSYTESLQVWTQFGEALHYLALTGSPLVNLTEPDKAMVRVHKRKDVDNEYIRNHKKGLQWAKEEQLKWMDESLVGRDIAKYIENRSPGALQLTDENISPELAALVELPVFHVGEGYILDIDCPEISPVGRYHVIDGLSWMDRSPAKKEEVIQQYSSDAERSQVLCDSRGLWINVLHRPKKDKRRPVSDISYTLSLLIMSLCEIETVQQGEVFHWSCSESPLCGRQHLVKQYMRLMVVDLYKEGMPEAAADFEFLDEFYTKCFKFGGCVDCAAVYTVLRSNVLSEMELLPDARSILSEHDNRRLSECFASKIESARAAALAECLVDKSCKPSRGLLESQPIVESLRAAMHQRDMLKMAARILNQPGMVRKHMHSQLWGLIKRKEAQWATELVECALFELRGAALCQEVWAPWENWLIDGTSIATASEDDPLQRLKLQLAITCLLAPQGEGFVGERVWADVAGKPMHAATLLAVLCQKPDCVRPDGLPVRVLFTAGAESGALWPVWFFLIQFPYMREEMGSVLALILEEDTHSGQRLPLVTVVHRLLAEDKARGEAMAQGVADFVAQNRADKLSVEALKWLMNVTPSCLRYHLGVVRQPFQNLAEGIIDELRRVSPMTQLHWSWMSCVAHTLRRMPGAGTISSGGLDCPLLLTTIRSVMDSGGLVGLDEHVSRLLDSTCECLEIAAAGGSLQYEEQRQSEEASIEEPSDTGSPSSSELELEEGDNPMAAYTGGLRRGGGGSMMLKPSSAMKGVMGSNAAAARREEGQGVPDTSKALSPEAPLDVLYKLVLSEAPFGEPSAERSALATASNGSDGADDNRVFSNPKAYREAFKRPMWLECQEGIRQSLTTPGTSNMIHVTVVRSRRRGKEWYELVIKPADFDTETVAQGDVLLLCSPESPLLSQLCKGVPLSECMTMEAAGKDGILMGVCEGAKDAVNYFGSKADRGKMVVRCMPVGPACPLGLSPQESIQGRESVAVVIHSILAVSREWEALWSVESARKLLPIILNPVKAAAAEESNPSGLPALPSASYMLNDGQSKAMAYACDPSKRAVLLQGPPGTGKTRVVVAILQDLLKRKTRRKFPILVSAPSNAAVDEIASRLLSATEGLNYKFIRIGNSSRVTHESVKEICLESLVSEAFKHQERLRHEDYVRARDERYAAVKALDTQIEEADSSSRQAADGLRAKRRGLMEALHKARDIYKNTMRQGRDAIQSKYLVDADVVFGTLNSYGSASVTRNLPVGRAEVCLIDEAAQAHEIASLIPLRFDPQRLILVGDPQQLPATVLSMRASTEYNLERSLFQKLQEASWPHHVMLTTQYRMHPAIAAFPSKHFYHGALIPSSSVLARPPFAPHMPGPMTFFDLPDSDEVRQGVGRSNPGEALLIGRLLQELMSALGEKAKALLPDGVGVISPYKQQVALLKRNLSYGAHDGDDWLEVGTVDSFQGREKDVIVVSTVRSSASSGIGFVADMRRLNVSITRAKRALWIVGDSGRLSGGSIEWRDLVHHCQSTNVLLDASRLSPIHLRTLLREPIPGASPKAILTSQASAPKRPRRLPPSQQHQQQYY